ncbi:PIR protein [Plasmodium yoelii]|uniref:Yir3 protein n=3 Tax=Plasmodium yoelii TaxID=5861 RepID=Q7RN61_PLAYO|nr:PIR protein [Plasmodium yoelii]EAA21366.1 putative yir3 protein [Plasmodium yoelii yoelii]WBY61388.1 PIR protein [Plasmodium yoelii yoelii]VTZ82041.1 PIR protein [Plasmodium yoelii]|eukprot:XP_034493643.1 PIR protein [Plasmodium yoelii]
MDRYMCQLLYTVRTSISDYLDTGGNHYFNSGKNFDKYCTNGSCDSNLGKINAGCLFLFDELIGNSAAKSNINIVEYIMIWLSYTLSQIKSGEKDNINEFYNKYINSVESYKKGIEGVTAYKNYKDLIDRNNYFLSMDKSIISKLYDALTSLCNMHVTNAGHVPNCDQCEKAANGFVKNYEGVISDSNITKNGLYRKILYVLYTLSNDYDNLKKKNNNSSSLPSIKTKIYMPIYGFSSLIFLIENNFYILLLIFGIIIVFIGIYYKYSLSGFRNRFKKLYLRKKLKKMKKEWTINI